MPNNKIKKIMVWGDSILKGVTQDENGKYRVLPQNCSALLDAKADVEVVNHARFGCTVTKGRAIMQADLNKGTDARYAVIEFGGNDCDFDWAQIAQDPNGVYEAKTPLATFAHEMEQMIAETRAAGIRPVLTTLPPIEPNRFFATISRGLNAQNILQWLGSAFTTYRWQENYSNTVAQVAKKNNVPLVDIRSAFLTERHYENFICEDGMHPNEKGHLLIANELQRFFVPVQA